MTATDGNPSSIPSPIIAPEGFRVIAHRGASALAPENTMAAFRFAQELGVREVELDVQLSRDGVLLVCHDRSLERYGHPGIALSSVDATHLESLDMGSWFAPEFAQERMIRLEDLLQQFGDDFTYHVEIKEPMPGIERATIQTIERLGLREACFVTSFHAACLQQVRELCPEMRTGWLVRETGLSEETIESCRAMGCTQICPPASILTVKTVQEAHKRIPEVRAHHVHTVELARRVVDTGCNGLTVNDPRWLTTPSP